MVDIPNDDFSLLFYENRFCCNTLAEFFVGPSDQERLSEIPFHLDEMVIEYHPTFGLIFRQVRGGEHLIERVFRHFLAAVFRY